MKLLVLLLSIALWFTPSIAAADTTTVYNASGSDSGDSTARYVAKDTDIVVLNKKTLKYHIPSCTYAKRCTKNCVKVKRSAAKDQGGVPCKVCGAGE
ncbi:MAG: hypothetical protein KC777_16305 [Cyanobacteria bacterium HKST-UBA02]|nr:hypothetical protein [Cyanobacteria bacterium HKST-UBA02]